jgi:Pectate lyase superfamily protein
MANTIPSDTHGAGDSGHTTDHNNIADMLTLISAFNVKNTAYAGGAKGDNSTDDTAAIQAALNAANSAGGGRVYLPAGTYKLTTVTVYNNTALIGDGPQASVLSCTGTPTAVVITDTSATGCVFRDFQINVNQVNGSVSHGLDLVSASGKPVTLHRVDNVFVYYAGKDGIHLGAAVIESHVSNCFTYGCNHGFGTEVSATDNKFTSCSAAQSTSDGFYIMGNTTHFLGCKSYYSGAISGADLTKTANWNDASGFHLAPAGSQTLSRVWMDSCEAQNNGTNGFFVDGSASSAVVDKCTFVDCASDGDNVKNNLGAGFKVYRATNCTFTNLDVNIGSGPTFPSTTVASGSNGGSIHLIASWATPSAGVLSVASTTGFSITGGTVNVAASGPTTAIVTYTGVSGNTLTGCAYVSGSASGTVATGGAVTQTSPTCQINYGLALFSTLTNTAFVNCHFTGNNGNVYTDGTVAGAYELLSCTGYNPVGKLSSPPAVAASTTPVTNTTGVDCSVIVTLNASVATSISIGGQATGITSSVSGAILPPVHVPVGQTIALTYSSTAPTWTWWGD